MRHLKTYEIFGFFKKKEVPIPKVNIIDTSQDILQEFVDENKIEILKQTENHIQYQLLSNSNSKWREEIDDIRKSIDPILKEWDIKHYYFHHVYLYIITDELYNEIYNLFKGLSKVNLVNNTYQYLLVKGGSFYMYINGEYMNIPDSIIEYLSTEYDIESTSTICDILEEVIPPMYKLGHYMRCRTIDSEYLGRQSGRRYHQPELNESYNEKSEHPNSNEYYVDLIYLLQDVFDEFNIIPKTDETSEDSPDHSFWSIRLKETSHMDGIQSDISNISDLGDRTIKFIVVFNISADIMDSFKKRIDEVRDRFISQNGVGISLEEEDVDGYLYDYVIRVSENINFLQKFLNK